MCQKIHSFSEVNKGKEGITDQRVHDNKGGVYFVAEEDEEGEVLLRPADDEGGV